MTKEILTFILDNEIYGIDIVNITEIIRADYHITPVPLAKPHVIGIFQPRDKVTNALDLKYCLYNVKNDNRDLLTTSEEKSILHEKYFIICDNKAWFIDNVKDIITFEESDKIEPSAITRKNKTLFINEIYKNEEDLIQVIDFDLIEKSL